MAKTKNEIILNIISRCENADEVVGTIGALITAEVVSINDVIKTMYNQHIKEMSSYDDKMSSYNDEYEELVGENIELTLKIAELENKLEEIRVEMIWNDDIPVKLKELFEGLL